MIFFTALEFANKLLGVFILAMLSRILGVDNFVQYSAILIVFGYFLELSFFSYQKRNLIDSCENADAVYGEAFQIRFAVLIFMSSVSAALFLLVSDDSWVLSFWPLFFVLLLPIFTLDFYLFASGAGRYIVIGRFISQSLACILLSFFYFLEFDDKYIFIVNLSQSLLLTLFILYCSKKYAGFSFGRLKLSAFQTAFTFKGLMLEFLEQKNVFISKILVLIVVSYEIALFSMLGENQHNDMVLGSRLVLIALPFLHFYLNSNIRTVNSNTYLKYIILNTLGVCALIVISPLLIYVLFGEGFLTEGFSLNYYISLIIFQAYVNYIFLLALKDSLVTILARRLALIIVLSVSSICSVHYWLGISSGLLLAFVVGKVALVILASPGVSIRYRMLTLLLFVMPIALNYELLALGFFDVFVAYIRFTQNFFWNLMS